MRWLPALLLVAGCSDPGATPLCETKIALVDHGKWAQVPEASDPFPAPPDGGMTLPRCAETDMKEEELNLELSYTINTRYCSFGTVEQPLPFDVAAGEQLTVRVWYFSQTRFDAAQAQVLVGIGADMLLSRTVALPVDEGGLLIETVPAPRAFPAGTPVRWHISNHGANTWNLIEVSVTRKEPCHG